MDWNCAGGNEGGQGLDVVRRAARARPAAREGARAPRKQEESELAPQAQRYTQSEGACAPRKFGGCVTRK